MAKFTPSEDDRAVPLYAARFPVLRGMASGCQRSWRCSTRSRLRPRLESESNGRHCPARSTFVH